MKNDHVTNANGCDVNHLAHDRGLTGEYMCCHPEGHTWLHPVLNGRPIIPAFLDDYGPDAMVSCCSRCGTYRISSPLKGHIGFHKPDVISKEWVQARKEENLNGNIQ